MAHILIADDDQTLGDFLIKALENAGHKTALQKNGLDALNCIKDTKEPFDLLITDIVMPGMDGLELVQKAKKISPQLKTMYITGFSGLIENNKVKNQHIMTKPFHLSELVQQAENLLSEKE